MRVGVHRARHSGPHRLSAARAQSRSRFWRPSSANWPPNRSIRAPIISSRPPWSSPPSMSAIRPPTSRPPKRVAACNIRFNDAAHAPKAWPQRMKNKAAAIQQRMGGEIAVKTSCERRLVPDRAGRLHRAACECRRRRDRHRAGTFDHRRHLGCALHQGSLPGGRDGPARHHHAQGRRVHAGRRDRKADRHLHRDPQSLFRGAARNERRAPSACSIPAWAG